jgi:alpha-1,2-mannosyltransferase
MGYAFTYPFVSLLVRVPIEAYVHYQTLSTDMLTRVRSRQAWHTNDDQISSSAVLSWMKLMCVTCFLGSS